MAAGAGVDAAVGAGMSAGMGAGMGAGAGQARPSPPTSPTPQTARPQQPPHRVRVLRALVFAATVGLAAPAHAQAPQRIVSLLPSLTETVCALQACDRLVGTDRHSNWPASVMALPKLGGMEDLQVERVVALKPDLVLAAASTRAVDRLRALKLRVVTLEPRNLADTQAVILAVADLLGHAERGPALWQDIERQLAHSTAQVPAAWRGRSVYFEIASTPYAAGESSFVGEVLARLSLRNVVPAALGPFPQISPEWVLRSAPQVVMGSAQALRDMPGRPGWSALAALQNGQHCGFDAPTMDTLVRPGPRLPDAAAAVLGCLQRLQAPAPALALR